MSKKLLFALSVTSALILPSRAAEPLPEISWNELSMGRKLGQGGCGEVFEARWRGIDVAVKRLSLRTLRGDEKQKSLREKPAPCGGVSLQTSYG